VSDREKKYHGLCAGGPLDGQKLSSEFKCIEFPTHIEGKGMCIGAYVWNETMRMWILK
jgi:hypothetical protein